MMNMLVNDLQLEIMNKICVVNNEVHDHFTTQSRLLHARKENNHDIMLSLQASQSINSSAHHIATKINMTNSIWGIINGIIDFKCKTIITLYKCLVRSHLEYANQIWIPHLVKHIAALEHVQRRVTRMITLLQNLG